MAKEPEYHDAYERSFIHAITVVYALGLLLVLGPRIGKFAADGTPRRFSDAQPMVAKTQNFHDLYWFLRVICCL